MLAPLFSSIISQVEIENPTDLIGLMISATERAHCNATVENALILPEGKAMMSHVQIADPWETGKPTQIPHGVKVNAHQ